jgi:hypothetical protein
MLVCEPKTLRPVRGEQKPRTGGNPYLRLAIGAILIVGTAAVWGWLGSLLPGAAERARIIDERELRATAIYYTDLKESAEGSEYIRHSLENPPGGKP